MEQTSQFLRQFGIFLALGIVGVGILVYGLWGQLVPEKATVEIIKGSENQNNKAQVVVNVAGEVQNPGVYTLPAGSRIGDAIVMAGGLSVSADRDWVAQTLNLASTMKDGEKIYIPEKNGNNASQRSSGKVNINTASVGELDSLVGIGEVRAQAIVANRPYGSTEELVSKAKIPQSVYEKIKDQISVY